MCRCVSSRRAPEEAKYYTVDADLRARELDEQMKTHRREWEDMSLKAAVSSGETNTKLIQLE